MSRFDYFILLAEMRTGSNFLEANLNRLDGVTCHGEAFNPSFIGYPKTEELLGVTREAREADPHDLLKRIKASDVMAGFRFFHNHDPRIVTTCLEDPACAKIILTRNPVDSFVSWKIAQATGQWKLTNATHAKSAPVRFDADAFEAHLEAIQTFQSDVQRVLQTTGQTAFYLRYEDLRDDAVINGLAAFLGVEDRLPNINKKLKKQNPEVLASKVSNYTEMTDALTRLDRFDLGRTPYFEPDRGPAIPTYVAAPKSGLIYMPLRSGPDHAVKRWLAEIDDAPVSSLITKFSQKSLRQWCQTTCPHRSFAVLRHPVARAHAAFCDRILFDGPLALPEIRANLERVHKMPLPLPDEAFDPKVHKAAFLSFLKFLRANLWGQTSIRVDVTWASQLAVLQGVTQFMVPDFVCREATLADDLKVLARAVGQPSPALADIPHAHEKKLAMIYDATIEKAAREAYSRDYAVFGFDDWRR